MTFAAHSGIFDEADLTVSVLELAAHEMRGHRGYESILDLVTRSQTS